MVNNSDEYNFPSKLYSSSTLYQRIAAGLAMGCGFLAIVFVSIWMKNSETDKSYLGGLNWSDLIFNWHPILMVSGLIFCSISAILSYRLFPLPKYITKPLHGTLHTGAVICFSIGLYCVFIGNNERSKNTSNGYYANLYSLHSMLGISAVVIYGQNYVLGFYHYLLPFVEVEYKKLYMPTHVFLGVFSFFAACFAALTGIMELTAELGCSYSVSSPDYNPAAHYHLLPDGCKVANAAGMFIFLTAFFAAYALLTKEKCGTAPEEERLIDTK